VDEAELEDPRRLVLFEPAAHDLHTDFPRIIHHQRSLDQVSAMLNLENRQLAILDPVLLHRVVEERERVVVPDREI